MEDHTAAVKIVSWFLAIVSAGAFVTSLLASRHLLRRKWLSFTLLFSALASNIGACVAVSFAATYGLGKSPKACSGGSLSAMQKAFYTVEILQALTLGLGKLSLVALFALLLSPNKLKRIIISITTVLGLWTASMMVATAAQCSAPNVWDLAHGSCIDVAALWRYWGATNILIEALMLGTVVFVVSRLHMAFWTQAIVIACFSARVVDIGVTAVQLNYSQAFYARGCDLQLQLWPWAMCGQVLQTVTIISASIPHLRDFLESFPSGMLRLHEMDSKTKLTDSGARTTLKSPIRSQH
ncbi:hypothetical protein N7468_003941 [Penicillium chermesinum]|uniref:Rhodopsin domain-containing protein n=1 Tax=Penicillium chermesinum TaxID=63820 RepID=A0A9W9PAB0_9EURO|nr:uncharacterized protein N7468_003941 [Penicillium chermesinum]KAJ5239322.1 hypothetical protein N7468_003941 [Penicillium chermesinum]KAJ6164949.1 hypothetical protein N7470_003621 [Penicillium chermesinum]